MCIRDRQRTDHDGIHETDDAVDSGCRIPDIRGSICGSPVIAGNQVTPQGRGETIGQQSCNRKRDVYKRQGEDKLVKQALKEGYKSGIYSDYAKDVIRPSAQECAANGRARSTKMRWAVRA